MKKKILTWMLKYRTLRLCLSKFYNGLNQESKERWHAEYSKLPVPVEAMNEKWAIRLSRGVEVLFPIEKFEQLLTVAGYDYEMKAFYCNFVGPKPVYFTPHAFIDIGANYGTHSAIFYSDNIDTFAIEPNPDCCAFIRRHSLADEVIRVAVGNKNEETSLFFPPDAPWLAIVGKTADDAFAHKKRSDDNPRISKDGPLHEVLTRMATIDSLVFGHGRLKDAFSLHHRSLLKLDVEGHEVEALEGAAQTLRKYQPAIILESFFTVSGEDRAKIYAILNGAGYGIYAITIDGRRSLSLSREHFIKAIASNFIAL